MNQQRIHMAVQPGPFVMAVTNWLVQPLRRALPAGLKQSRWDWASLLAAVLLSLLYGAAAVLLLSLVSFASPNGAMWLTGALLLALKHLVRTVLQGLMLLLLAYAVLSWVQPHASVMGTLERLSAPILRPVRRVVPLVGGVDLSVLVVIVLLQVGLMVLG
jgi:YggT family protein